MTLTPLHLTPTTPPSSCPACDLGPSGPAIYSCAPCNFFLHEKCLDFPPNITHPFHNQHVFTLLPRPAYPDALFNCDACGLTGRAFCYHCKTCGLDLHPTCASMPLSLAHARHPHELRLAFESPYGEFSGFCCDICKGPGGPGRWLYRCGPCGFDAHLKCAGVNNNAVGVPAAVGPTVGFGLNSSRQNNEMLVQAIQQRVSRNNAMVQAILAGRAGGGYGGRYGGANNNNNNNNEGLQQLMQMMSGGNYNNGVLGGVGSGGGFDWQSLLGGGGGGLNFLGGAFGGFGF
ncbi:cysteine/Histidine-rich C1 domain family protein [Striga asiatica]|uniref:Cysteine/Histidine-rich C1 domain family protein n=1 Tax=Striga asiatica TaxID=4170 RepID=A0A5A7Q3F2_STRAF|nr:cysteine/Histidine-rich C1 domain family protein [Striga asiatica]